MIDRLIVTISIMKLMADMKNKVNSENNCHDQKSCCLQQFYVLLFIFLFSSFFRLWTCGKFKELLKLSEKSMGEHNSSWCMTVCVCVCARMCMRAFECVCIWVNCMKYIYICCVSADFAQYFNAQSHCSIPIIGR